MEQPANKYISREGEERSFIGASLSAKDLYLLAKAMNEALQEN